MQNKRCVVTGCRKSETAAGLCHMHYMRFRRTGTVDKRVAVSVECSVDGCSLQVRARGWCNSHWSRWKKTGDVRASQPIRMLRTGGPICAIEGCEAASNTALYCRLHAHRIYRTNKAGPAGKLRSDNGMRRYIDPNGYVVISGSRHEGGVNNGGILEHRKVMQDVLGRHLLQTERVHHRNGDRSDNRPDNLELWLIGHPAGQRVKDQVAWARRILALYGEMEPE